MSRKCGMPWMKLNSKSYCPNTKSAEHHGNNKAIMCEALKERWSKDPDINREQTQQNLYYGYKSGLKLYHDINKEITSLSKELRSQNKRGIRKDAITSFAGIVKPDKEIMEQLSFKDQIRFFQDALTILNDKFGTNPNTGRKNIRSAVIQLDEGNIHMHYFGVPYTADGRLSAKEIFTPKLSRWMNEEFPRLMNDKGWDLEPCRDENAYDPKTAKTLNNTELQKYKEKCIQYKKEKRQRHGQTASEYKNNKEIQKSIIAEKEKLKQIETDFVEKCSIYQELGNHYYNKARNLFLSLSRDDKSFQENKQKLYEQSIKRTNDLHVKLDESLLPHPCRSKEKQKSL